MALPALAAAAGAALAFGGNIASAVAQKRQNERVMDFNARQAEIQRNWEAEMSNTAYQRSTADMRKAGLNPALMYGSGSAASTPSGASASASGMQSPRYDMSAVMASALEAYNTNMRATATAAGVANTKADTYVKEKQAKTQAALETLYLTQSGINRQTALRLAYGYDAFKKEQDAYFKEMQIKEKWHDADLQNDKWLIDYYAQKGQGMAGKIGSWFGGAFGLGESTGKKIGKQFQDKKSQVQQEIDDWVNRLDQIPENKGD